MKVSIIQSNFIPWIGYLSIIKNSDIFILFEDVQYTKNDWRNRNRLLINNKDIWVSIPVNYRDKQNFQTIITCDTKLFFKKFTKTIELNYSNKKNYKKIKDKFENVVEKACKEKKLKFINRIFLNFLLELFEIKTKVIYLEKSPKIQDPTEKLIKILKKYNATEYLSGGLAQNYLREELFSDADLKLKYVDYENLIKPFVNNSNINYINYSSLQFFLES